MLLNLKRKIGIKLFNRRKALKYILFDKIYSLFILNKKKLPLFLKRFDTDGFAQIDPNVKQEITDLNKILELDKIKEDPPFHFLINDDVKKNINNILSKIEFNIISYLKNYFNSDILPAYICLRRNTFYEKNSLGDELYNNNFHNDAYLFTHFKIFVNLNDVSKKSGPMKIVPKRKTHNFLKKINYLDRTKYNDYDENYSYANVGKYGDCLLFDPTNCFHSAGIPEENYKRDYLIITYVCIPKKREYLEKFKEVDIYKYYANKLLSFSKPTKFFETIKIFLNFYRSKIN